MFIDFAKCSFVCSFSGHTHVLLRLDRYHNGFEEICRTCRQKDAYIKRYPRVLCLLRYLYHGSVSSCTIMGPVWCAIWFDFICIFLVAFCSFTTTLMNQQILTWIFLGLSTFADGGLCLVPTFTGEHSHCFSFKFASVERTSAAVLVTRNTLRFCNWLW